MARAFRNLFLVLLTAAAFAAATPARADTPVQTTTACGLEAKVYFTQGQPIVMRFRLENNTFEPVIFNLGYDREGAFRFRLKRPDGKTIELPQKTVREGIARVDKVTVPAQATYSQQLILDEWYKFTETGSYTVTLTVPNTCGPMELPVEITPLDTETLSKACEELVEAIRANKNNYEKASDAAKALATVDNPLAVPFLAKALEANRMVDSIVVPGIERIGGTDAVRSLISILEQHEYTTSEYELARAALVRLKKRSAAEDVEIIRIALARFPPSP